MLITSVKIIQIECFWTFLTSTFLIDVKKLQNCPIRTILQNLWAIEIFKSFTNEIRLLDMTVLK